MTLRITLALSLLCALTTELTCQTYWNGFMIPVTKLDYSPVDSVYSQDRITDSTWFTRDIRQGLYDIFNESSHNRSVSPINTLWAKGTFADSLTLDFDNWEDAVDRPRSFKDTFVCHLVEEDIYFHWRLHRWTSSAAGGGFTYYRSTPPPSGPKNLEVYGNDHIENGDSSYTRKTGTYFGPILPGDTLTKTFIVGNTGTSTLQITNINVPSGPFNLVVPTSFPLNIQPGSSDTFTISFSSLDTMNHVETIEIMSDDPDEPSYKFKIKGKAASTLNSFVFEFCKFDYVDADSAGSQDRITDSVKLTRRNNMGLFNYAKETEYNNQLSSSPEGTLWLRKNSDNAYDPDYLTAWKGQFERDVPDAVGEHFFVYLNHQNLLIDLKLTQWTSNSDGGGFCYERNYPKSSASRELHVFTSNEMDNGDFSPEIEKSTLFAPLSIGDTVISEITLGNSGTSDLMITEIEFIGNRFTLPGLAAQLPIIISADSTFSFSYKGVIDAPGNKKDTLSIESDDLISPTFEFAIELRSPVLWTGFKIPFCKRDNADPTDSVNQDRISDYVWLTRGDNMPMYNAKIENSSDQTGPKGTLWRYGHPDINSNQNFQPWEQFKPSDPNDLTGVQTTIYLKKDNVKLGLLQTSWTSNSLGGGFCYVRNTPSPSGPARLEVHGTSQIYDNDNTPDIRKGTYFGPIPSDRTQRKYYVIGNPGTSPLIIDGISATGSKFIFENNPVFPDTILPGGSDTICIRFSSVDTGFFESNISITTNEIANPSFDFKVGGRSSLTLDGYKRPFCKEDFADETLPENHDSLSAEVVLARASSQGLYNLVEEDFHSNNTSPANTQWLFGGFSHYSPEYFRMWRDAVQNNPPSMVDNKMTIFLEKENSLMEIEFTSWTENANGGGYCYTRSGIPASGQAKIAAYMDSKISHGDTLPSIGKGNDLGCSFICSSILKDVLIGNDGSLPLTIDSITLGQIDFKIKNDLVFPLVIEGGKSAVFTLEYVVNDTITRQTDINIFSNAENHGNFSFRIKANGCPDTLWNGLPILFCKTPYEDYTKPSAQDMVTDSVIITRMDDSGIFNYVTESGFDSDESPEGTLWVLDEGQNPADLEFLAWNDENQSGDYINTNTLVKLTRKGVALKLKTVDWSVDESGGGFCYYRSTAPVSGTSYLGASYDLRPIKHNNIPDYLEGTSLYTPIGTSVDRKLILHNQGSDTLNISDISIIGSDLAMVYPTVFPKQILPNKTLEIKFNFIPTSTLSEAGEGSINIIHDGDNGNQFTINLKTKSTIRQLWNGPKISFCKDNYADWTSPGQHDQISELLKLTRQDRFPIFNLYAENVPRFKNKPYTPELTKWADGNLDNGIGGLVFDDLINDDREGGDLDDAKLVLFNEPENYYMEVEFHSWTDDGDGGGFCYTRSLPVDSTFPELLVYGKGKMIPAGRTETTVEDGTNFGLHMNTSGIMHEFILVNNGKSPLTIYNLGVVGDVFQVNNSINLPLSIPPTEGLSVGVLLEDKYGKSNHWKGSFYVQSSSKDNPNYTFGLEAEVAHPLIWQGDTIFFEKDDYDDPELETSQDRILENLWLTRGDDMGVYNAFIRDEYVRAISPEGTLWSMNPADQYRENKYKVWREAVNSSPPLLVGTNSSVLLEDINELFDIEFTNWTSNDNGGGFAYIRKTRFGMKWNGIPAENSGGVGTSLDTAIFTVYACDSNAVKLEMVPEDIDWNWMPGTSLSSDTGSTVFWFPNQEREYTVIGISPTDTLFAKVIARKKFSCPLLDDTDIEANSSCSVPDGEIDVEIDNDGLPVILRWSNGIQDTNIISGLTGGNYSLTVTDACMCEEIYPFIVPSDFAIDTPAILCPPNINVNNDPGIGGAIIELDHLTLPDSIKSIIPFNKTESAEYTGSGTTTVLTFNGLRSASSNVLISTYVSGDFGGDSEFMTFTDQNGNLIGVNPGKSNDDCEEPGLRLDFNLSSSFFNLGLNNNEYNVIAIASSEVDDFCDSNFVRVSLKYDVESPFIQNNFYPENLGDASGFYSIGTSNVVYSIVDTCFNIEVCSTTITVNDIEDPEVLKCPTDITLAGSDDFCGAVLDFEVLFEDNALLQPMECVQILGPAPGDTFGLGTTNVFYQFTDPAGGSIGCGFEVTVTGAECCPLSIDNISKKDVSGLGKDDGSITILASCPGCGFGDIEYSIDNGATWSDIPSFYELSPGNYGLAVRDKYSPSCVRYALAVIIDQCAEILNLTGSFLPTDIYRAGTELNSISRLAKNGDVEFYAGKEIYLKKGFEVPKGTSFKAIIEACVD